jgi:ActR/RegA family two-component response regulator
MARILVVDDSTDWQQTVKGLLTDAGHDVTSAGNEGEALSAAVGTSFDLAVIDVRLHGDAEDDESGIWLAFGLKKLAPLMKIILLTGYSPRLEQVVKSIRLYGIEDYIEKSRIEGPHGDNLKTIVQKTLNEPSFQLELDQLSLSLEPGQPILVRTRGSHTCALRTNRVFRLSIPRYNRLAQQAGDAFLPRFNIKVIGENLYHEVFKHYDEVRDTFIAARAGTRLLCLTYEGDRDYLGIPFEFIFLEQPEEYLILEHPVTRFINGAVPKRKAFSPQIFSAFKNELRILLVASNTYSNELPSIPGVDQEVEALAALLSNQQHVKMKVTVINTDETSISYFKKVVDNCRPHILHYAGHGSFNEESPERSSIFFWSQKKRKGTVKALSAGKLKDLLQDSEVRLAYFSSCYGATTGTQSDLLDDDFLGIADTVIQAGVPSVIGFRWPVSDAGAPKLAEAFYRSLLRQGSPEIALWEARRELAGLNRDDPTWLSPILIHQV